MSKEAKLNTLASKMLVTIAISLAVLVIGTFIQRSSLSNKLRYGARLEVQLKNRLDVRNAELAKIEFVAKQTRAMQKNLDMLLTKLPTGAKMDQVLANITKLGTNNGLTFNLFDPESEKRFGFYATLPIKMAVEGTYHNFAKFISGINNLPEMVGVNSFNIGPNKAKPNQLTMHLTITVYHRLV